MSTPSLDVGDGGALTMARRIDEACLRFEAAWQAGGPAPSVEEFAEGLAPPARTDLLRELILLDIHYRRLSGDEPTAVEYQARFPDLGAGWLDRAVGMPADPNDLTGGRLGPYHLARRIGRGVMGAVYAAEDPARSATVAIKVLARELALDPEAVRRFRREARATLGLRHPNIVPTLAIEEERGTYYLVMEYIEGGSLQDRLRSGGPIPWREATCLAADACRGMRAAHAAGVLHRDIKPANILLERDGTARLADFGLAKLVHDASASLSLTELGRIVGSPHFMSPEQCRGLPVDERSDLYSLGATYYALLAGRPPFPAAGPIEVLFAQCHQQPPDPCSVDPGLPHAAGRIVRRAMAKDPADRFADAAEMLEALRALAASEDGNVAPRRAIPRRAWLGAALGGAGCALAGLSWFGVSSRRSGSPAAIRLARPVRTFAMRAAPDFVTFTAPEGARPGYAAPGTSEAARIAAASRDGSLRVWDSRDGGEFLASDDVRPIHALASSDHARYLVVLRPLAVESLDTKRDPDRFVSIPDMAIWDFYPAETFGAMEFQAGATTPDGAWLAAAISSTERPSGAVLLHHLLMGGDVPDDTPLGRFREPVRVVALSTAGQVASVARAKSLQLWNTRGEALGTLAVGMDRVECVAFAGEDLLVVAGGRDVELWDLTARRLRRRFPTRGGEVTCVACPPHIAWAVWAEGPTIRVLDLETGRDLGMIAGHDAAVQALALTTDGRRLTSGGADRKIALWDLTPLRG